DCRSKEPPRRLTWLRTMVLKLDAGFDDGTLLSVISKSGRDRAICPSQPDYGSSPDGFPRAADRIIATSRSEAGTAQRIGTPNCTTYATDTCSATPPECAIGPSSNAGRPALNVTCRNNSRHLTRALLIRPNRQHLLI